MEDRVRRLIRVRAAELKRPLSDLSRSIGKNHAYLQQYLERGIPLELPQAARLLLAKELDIDELILTAERNSAPAGQGDAERISLAEITGNQFAKKFWANVLHEQHKAELWRVTSDAMSGINMIHGEIIVVDPNGDFNVPGAVVLAIKKEGGQERALLRSHYAPKLFAVRENPPNIETVDNTRIMIRGLVLRAR